jgi:hypothetical protein
MAIMQADTTHLAGASKTRLLTDEEADRVYRYTRALADVGRTRRPRKSDLDGKSLEELLEEVRKDPELREALGLKE